MRRNRYLLTGIGVAIIVLGVGFVGFTAIAGHAATNTPPTIPPPPPPPRATIVLPRPNFTVVPPTIGPQTGTPGIPPTFATTDPKAATFTEQDVRNYYAQQHAKNAPNVPVPTIAKVSFLTVGQAASTLSLNLAFDKNELLCVVQFNQTGTLPASDSPKPIAYTTVYEIFSAHTGSQLGMLFR